MSGDKVGILVISEDRALRKELRTSLEACGFTITEALASADGLQTLDDGFHAHIVVTDMPPGDIRRFHADVLKRGGDWLRMVSLTDMALAGLELVFTRPWHYMFFENAMQGMMRGVGPMGADRGHPAH